MHKWDVLSVGRNCMDYIAIVEQFPEEDQKIPLEFRMVEGGGQGGTSACCIARLGGRVQLVGSLGDDSAGRFCRQRLKDFGVATDHVQTIAGGRTPVAYLFVTRASGKRTIIYEKSDLPPIEATPALLAAAAQSRTILIAPDVTRLSADLSAQAGLSARVIYDAERWRPGMEAMMGLADYFIPPRGFLTAPELGLGQGGLDDHIWQLQEKLRGQLVVTAGEAGAFFPVNRRLYHVPAPDVAAIDTIGAGDNFHGAFALAVARGLDIFEAVRFSVAVASLSCTAYGGRDGLPDMDLATDVAQTLRVDCISD